MDLLRFQGNIAYIVISPLYRKGSPYLVRSPSVYIAVPIAFIYAILTDRYKPKQGIGVDGDSIEPMRIHYNRSLFRSLSQVPFTDELTKGLHI